MKADQAAAGSASALPHPPPELINQAGVLDWDEEISQYDAIGAISKRLIVEELPAGWSFDGRRVLDFGCGAGRVIRHFEPEARTAELIGCDIDGDAIEWATAHLDPPFGFMRTAELPPLSEPDESFDLIYSISVFTHLTDSWAAWLLELRRLLKIGGLLALSFIGEGVVQELTGEPYDEALIGKNDLHVGTPWSLGGPTVLHSPWWLRNHLGRVFDVVSLRPYADAGQRWGHGIVCLRKQPGREAGIADLERPDPSEPRELSSMRHNLRQLRRELRHLQRQAIRTSGGWASRLPPGLLRLGLRLEPQRTPRDLDGLRRELDEVKRRVGELRRAAVARTGKVGDPGLEPGTSS